MPGIYLTHIRYQHQWEIGFSDRQNKSRDLGSVIQAMKPYMDNHGKCLAIIGDAEFCLDNPDSTPADVHRAKREIEDANEKIASIESQSAQLVARRVELEAILEEADRLMAMKSERRWWFSFDLSKGAEIVSPVMPTEGE